MTDESPWTWLLVGLAVSATGGFVLYSGLNAESNEDLLTAVGYAVGGLGAVLVQVAAVALGVSTGMTHHARRRQR